MNKECKIGDTILIEQAWEDEKGNYHDEYAEVLEIARMGHMKLKFLNVPDEVDKHLQSFGYFAEDYEPLTPKPYK